MASYARSGRSVSGKPTSPIKPRESARYTREMLESLRKIALGQEQSLLAHLLNLAAMEAGFLADQAQDT